MIFYGAAVFPLAECAPALKPLIEDRGSCNADNLLRLLRTPTNLPEALPFCSSYLHIPACTKVVGTVTPTGTQYSTIVDTISPTATSLTTEVDSIEPTETLSTTDVSTNTDYVTVTSQATTVTTVVVPAAARRAVKTPLAQRVTETYDASRISSACACLTIPYSVSSVTATAEPVTVTLTVDTTTTAPEVTNVNTILTTTTLPEVTQIVTVDSTTDIAVTTTVVSVVTSTSTTQAGPAPTAFYLRLSDGSYIVNRNENPTNNGAGASQVWVVSQDASTATTFKLTAEGYLSIVKPGTAYTNAPVGQESANWVVFNHPSVAYEAVYMNKLASVNGCTTCVAVKFLQTTDAQGTAWITPNPASINKSFWTCNFPNTAYGRGLYLSATQNSLYNCVAAQVYFSTV
ncbi:hypothetical protein CONLIGDRAFT_626893 [Coniochaeta ligniaria NRRL 30616]|uniref:Uncharacterized protein n=1 Tax=Coniochaeta ligniaria NRRL 30616 TaxID=1408157 RepID=A0A1J7K3T4_9PEZI|nr:hypothetical protein CONLIGDRAFT_626893 [Coniochaeta ligniaria NRRL 30616]